MDRASLLALLTCTAGALLSAGSVALAAQELPPGVAEELPPTDTARYAGMSGEELYRSSCATCHGMDGTGARRSTVAFQEALPDFTDCRFARREPDADWVGVAHQGGPSRGFSRMMPAFGGVLQPEELRRVMGYVRTLCQGEAWPRGELNLPRALLTEKAFPEDEWVLEATSPVEGGRGAVMSTIVYEKRFGPRTQVEVLAPFGVRERPGPGGGAGDWVGGLGDVTLGVKHALFHSLTAGSIVSVAGEVRLPTGHEEDGFGSGHTVWEAFVAYGQLLPAASFLQLQGVLEVPASSEVAEEAVARAALGRTWTQGRWGRTWTPILEVQAARELASGNAWSWDVVPQLQVSLNTRQHVRLNVGVLLPVSDAATRDAALHLYLLWDWFDGGFFEGW
jgi:mono/diheme cytochrome c family protein